MCAPICKTLFESYGLVNLYANKEEIMRILWVNNIAIPQIADDIAEKSTPVGGWMVKLAEEVSEVEDIQLHILFPCTRSVCGCVNAIKYTGFINKYKAANKIIKSVLDDFNPDIIHIFGTEYEHSFWVTKICEEKGILDRVAVSIQGLVSVYAKHYTAFLDSKIVKGYTFRDILKGNIIKNRKEFIRRGKYEIETLKRVKNIIGRTDWDCATTYFINPQRKYFFNNEMLRNSFYASKWNINLCKKHSVFFSQATSPIKGLHIMLDAVVLLKNKYPDIQLSIAGKSFMKKPKMKRSYYEEYIINSIKNNRLEENVIFTGFLDEKQMCDKYLQSHVFVSSSSIENSPNSVCEAMILGVPTISSMVGGVANLMTHGVDGFFYQADASYMLAYYVDKIFENDNLAVRISQNARHTATLRHDSTKIVNDLMTIYNHIANDGE